MFELYPKKSDCCGCGVCAAVCPKHAITMTKDPVGFFYPSIDQELCVSCGLCKKSCAFQKEHAPYLPKKVYAMVRRDPDALIHSASGGAFSVLAERMIAEGGVVFGAALEPENGTLIPRHRIAETPGELSLLRGSKYVQSSLGNTFAQTQCLLDAGKKVLFSGTPCQIGALYAYLKQDHPNLLTVDLACHGVPSAQMFQDYLQILEQDCGGTITQFQFRFKNKDWGKDAWFEYRDHAGNSQNRIVPRYDSSYLTCFFQSLILRDSCHNCAYAGGQHPADITVADFWGFTQVHPELLNSRKELDPNAGLSALMVNSEKGASMLSPCLNDFHWVVSSFNKVLVQNPRLASPNPAGEDRARVLALYAEKGYAAVDREFRIRKRKNALIDLSFRIISRCVPKSLRTFGKRILHK